MSGHPYLSTDANYELSFEENIEAPDEQTKQNKISKEECAKICEDTSECFTWSYSNSDELRRTPFQYKQCGLFQRVCDLSYLWHFQKYANGSYYESDAEEMHIYDCDFVGKIIHL